MSDLLPPLNDAVVMAMANLVDDSLGDRRYPSHNDLDFLLEKVGLTKFDPKTHGQSVGKRKRIRAVLSSALEHEEIAGRKLVSVLLSTVRANGGFRKGSPNFVGNQAIENLIQVFRYEGFDLSKDGELRPLALEGLSEKEYTDVLWSYIRRARQGANDAALLLGTGKDLLEATAKHVLEVRTGQQPKMSDFPTLLANAFMSLEMVTSQHKKESNESPTRDYERALFELGCAINRLRNREGTGHGRLFLPSVSDEQARNIIQATGLICEYMLRKLY